MIFRNSWAMGAPLHEPCHEARQAGYGVRDMTRTREPEGYRERFGLRLGVWTPSQYRRDKGIS